MINLKGKKIRINIIGIPPYKDVSRSIRNSKHPYHKNFLELRKAAKIAMKKLPYYKGPVEILFHYTRKDGNRSMWDYLSGICDTLDGSHGFTFHWEPIVFLDDRQIIKAKMVQNKGDRDSYYLEIKFS